MKKIRTAVIVAVFISVATHGAFFASSRHVLLSGMHDAVEHTRRMFRLNKVEEKVTKVELFRESKPHVSPTKMASKLSRPETLAFKKMLKEEKPAEDIALKSKKEQMRKEKFDDMQPDERRDLDMDKLLKPEADKPVIEEAKKRSLAERVMADDSLVKHKVRSGGAIMQPEAAGVKSDIVPKLDAGEEMWTPSEGGMFQPGTAELASLEDGVQVGDYEDIDRYLNVRLITYKDPRSGKKYFKISINARKDSALEVMPKEVIFMVDSSKSMTEQKIYYIKKGLLASVRDLNPGDRFNIVAFRGDVIKFSDTSVGASNSSAEKAKRFIEDLAALGQTDVEKALLETTKSRLDFSPSYVVLVTDGRPTKGVKDSRDIIRQITRSNNMTRPIFCFGGGSRVNKYLLDFISYQNRAWSYFVPTAYEISEGFYNFYSQIKDPLLLNLRYRLSGPNAKHAYPRNLSDFYAGRPLSVYGRFNDEDTFSMQLLGDINGTVKEFIFKRSFSQAETGGREIAEEWAFHKIYDLISQNTMGIGNAVRVRAEIDRLSSEYGIKTPYDIEDMD